MHIIAVSGVDGSGKSTFVEALRRGLQDEHPGLSVATLWLRFDPRASSRPEGRAPSARPRVVSTLDARHRGSALKRLALRAGARHVWTRLATTLYRRQLSHQLAALRGVDLVLVDRFVLDFAADLVGAGVLTAGEVPAVLRQLPAADLGLVLTVPAEVLLERRDAAESPERLLERASLYEDLARRLGLKLIDARDTAAAVAGALEDARHLGVLGGHA